MIADAAKAAVLLILAAVVQTAVLSSIQVLGGTPDLVLVLLVAIALLRGSIFGAAAGFWAGLLLDTATLETLGFTSLLYTVGGYWIGRYGETTGRDRTHAPFVATGVVTALFAVGALALHFMLGDSVSARVVLLETLPGSIVLNLLLTLPVYTLCRRLFPLAAVTEPAREVRLLV